METNMWAKVRLDNIRKTELRKTIAWGESNKDKWWWDEEQERHHQTAIQEYNELTNKK
jgi:hypothetical protein